MSGMEVVAVIGCVAAVVSAYKDGGKIVKQIKEKRAAKKALAPTQSLESSLERGPLAVEQAKDSGIARYGPRFATGDQVATEALRDILIKLQGTLLTHLWSAQEDDNVTDFHVLVDASDFGRIQSVTVLNELYMRMAQAAPLQLPVRKPTADLGSIWEIEDPSTAAASDPAASQILTKSPPVSILSDQNQSHEESKKDPGRLHESTRRKWRMFPPRTRKLESETASEILTPGNISPLGIAFGENVSSAGNSSSGVTSERSVPPKGLADDAINPPPWKLPSELSIDEENPWREEPSTSNGGDKNAASPELSPRPTTIANMPRRQSTEATLIEDPSRPLKGPKPMRRIAPYKPRKQWNSEAAPVVQSGTPPESKWTQKKFPYMSRRRTQNATSPLTHKLTSTTSSPPITRTQTNQSVPLGSRDPYGGFCKGAYKLQVGLDKESVKIRSQSVSMTGESNYWACASSKCAFEGPACKNGKDWVFDDTVRVSNDAVQYRWTFLAKCHVALSNVRNGYDYQCVFCGVQPSSNNVYRGEKAFIEHVSQQHRGQQPDPSFSDRICCIHDRMALEEEGFDVNLPPREDSSLVHRPVVVETPDLISGFNDHNVTPDDGVSEWPAVEHWSSTVQRNL